MMDARFKKFAFKRGLAFAAILAGALSMNSSSAQAAYFVVSVGAPSLDPHRRTHVVIAGYGNDLGTAPQIAATAKVRKIAEIYPSDQILFICARELSEEENIQLLRRIGYENIRSEDQLLTVANLMNELKVYDQIAGLHVYSHSGITPGIFLDLDPTKPPSSNDLKWAYDAPAASLLVGHFTSDAIVTLNGCNSGHAQAPYLAQLWKVPVSGALTSTHFEALYQDGNYYWADPSQSQFLADNTLGTMQTKIPCNKGACYRMRPDNWDYIGVYGHYFMGLPNYQFFCVGISDAQCTAGMAHSILIDVSSQALSSSPTLEQYTRAVQEWICPTDAYSKPTQSRCMAELAKLNMLDLSKADVEYTPFGGRTANCTFSSCYRNSECLHPEIKVCALSPQPDLRHSTTFIDEYAAYLRGYSAISGSISH